MRLKRQLFFGGALILLGVLFAVGSRSFWLQTTYVDAFSGRMKVAKSLFGYEHSSTINAVVYSELVETLSDARQSPVWKIESRTPVLFGDPSPHFGYHGAFQWQNRMVDAFYIAGFSEDIKERACNHFRRLMLSDQPVEAQNFSDQLFSFAMNQQGQRITIENAPEWLAKTPAEK